MPKMLTQKAMDSMIWSVCDIMRRSNRASALQYVPETTWILFLRIFDEMEQNDEAKADILGVPYNPAIEAPYRWRDWASPAGDKRKELQDGSLGLVLAFVNSEVLPRLRGLKDQPESTWKQKVVSQILSGVEKVGLDSERNFLDVLDKIDEIRAADIDPTHTFAISQVYEHLLLRMGEKAGDGGQFFTPREVIRFAVQVVNPHVGETVYDPACGTGGFLAQAYEHMRDGMGGQASAEQVETLGLHTFYGREKEDLIYPVCLANLVLHGIERPNIWHGNSLTGKASYAGLWADAPAQFKVILANPPFGGKEGEDAQTLFAYKTGATQILFLQHMIDALEPGGRAGIVIDEGSLFRTNEQAFVQTRRKLLDECDLECVVSLPGGVFTAVGAGVKTNLLFFTKGKPTEKVWYYDLSDLKVSKKSLLTADQFAEFFALRPTHADSEHSWTVSRSEIEANGYSLKAVNPNRREEIDERTPEELIALIEEQSKIILDAMSRLREK